MAMQAQDTFIAVLDDGTEKLVTKGQPFSDSHELVKRDLAASKDNPGRTPLFAALDLGEDDKPEPKTAPKAPAKGSR